MDNRFTIKDFFLFAAIGAVLVTLLLAMYMVDRQWTMMERMHATMQEQAQDLRAVRTDLKALDQRVESGVLAAARAAAEQVTLAAAPPDTPAAATVFERAMLLQ